MFARLRPHWSPLALALILLLYGALSFYQLDLPGLHYDEAFEAVPALQLLRGQPVTTFREHGLPLAGRTWPLMTQDYIGALNSYLVLPFIAALGPTPVALRSMSIGVGGVTLLLAYLLAARLSGQRWVGVVAALLLAVEPTFIFWNRQGLFVTAITAPIGLAMVYCGWRRGQASDHPLLWSGAAAFLAGLGLYAKLLFIWLIGAAIGAVILLNWAILFKKQSWARWVNQLSGAELAGVGLAFLGGCWPLLLYNLQTGGTFLSVSQNAETSYYGVNNMAMGANLLTRLQQLVVLLTGGQFWYFGRVVTNFWAFVLIILFLGIIVYFATRKNIVFSQKNSPSPPKIALFPYLVIGLTLVASIGTVSALWVTHFAVLMPWPSLALALSGWYILQNISLRPLRRGRLWRAAVWAGLLLLMVTQLLTTLRYHQALSVSGGLGAHSDAVYDLSDWLASHAQGPVVAMDWGLAAPVTYLTGGQVTPTEVFGYAWQSDVQLKSRLNHFIRQPKALYLWRAPDEIIFDRSDEFKALYQPAGREENIEEAFYERSGRPILGVTRLVPSGAASNPPQ